MYTQDIHAKHKDRKVSNDKQVVFAYNPPEQSQLAERVWVLCEHTTPMSLNETATFLPFTSKEVS